MEENAQLQINSPRFTVYPETLADLTKMNGNDDKRGCQLPQSILKILLPSNAWFAQNLFHDDSPVKVAADFIVYKDSAYLGMFDFW